LGPDYAKLKLEQTEELLRPFRRVAGASAPRNGWVRAIREALGMSAMQLAARLNVTRQSIEDLERNEASGKITLERLTKLAGAMNCRVVYALVPEQPLAAIQRDRAHTIARRQLQPVAHSMKLEAQGVSQKEEARQLKLLIQKLLAGNPKRLWE
jgi:predicted DNA-binding mobile mystery protein A